MTTDCEHGYVIAPDCECPLCTRDAEIARLRENNAALRVLVAYAAESSTVTTSDNPGCFWCDHERHTRDCRARKALKVKP